MAIFNFRRKTEDRAEGEVQFEDALLKALTGQLNVTKEMALQIPTISGGIDLIANVIAGTPIKLYRDNDGKAEEVNKDPRLKLLNDETGDTLNANEFWRAMIRDYYTGKGGYAYINKNRGKVASIHYVDEQFISIIKNTDPIFKDYKILVKGSEHNPSEFFKILRNTRDGAEGEPITKENSRFISAAFQQLLLEYAVAKRGGNKKGFLKSEKRIDQGTMESLRAGFRNLYSNDENNMMVLNNGVDFVECSDTNAEMQLNENKRANAEEFAKIFHISADVISGKATDINGLAKLAALPLMQVIQCALNRDLLLEREKGTLYFAFDTKELLKGEMKERFEAYKTALEANFMQIDEVRYAEDMEPLGLNWIKLGLDSVLYDPKTKLIYTPNTNQTGAMQENTAALQERADDDILNLELRYNDNHDEKGRFTAGSGGSSSEKGKSGSGRKGNKNSNRESYTKVSQSHAERRFVGKRTSDGRTVKKVNYHAVRKMNERGITPESVLIALKDKKPTDGNKPHTKVYSGPKASVVYDTKEDAIWTIK